LPGGIVSLQGEIIGGAGRQVCNRILQDIARINFCCGICQDALLAIEYCIAGDSIRAFIPGKGDSSSLTGGSAEQGGYTQHEAQACGTICF
jgi:hypothetical protein